MLKPISCEKNCEKYKIINISNKICKLRIKESKKLLVTKQNYSGYKSTDGMKFNSQQEMIEATGKQIMVNGIVYISCGAAATYIVEQEAELGNIRNKDTISKELRRYLQGKRTAWKMYDRYSIGN